LAYIKQQVAETVFVAEINVICQTNQDDFT